jgi:hypothetical protein
MSPLSLLRYWLSTRIMPSDSTSMMSLMLKAAFWRYIDPSSLKGRTMTAITVMFLYRSFSS